jgi:hypothetical protein
MPLAIVAVVVAYVATHRLPEPRSWLDRGDSDSVTTAAIGGA